MHRLLILALFLSFALPISAQTLYVLPGGGSLGTTGVDWAHACNGFAVACDVTSNGAMASITQIWVAGGITFNQQSFSATHASPITVQAATVANHGTGTGWINSMAATALNPIIFTANTTGTAELIISSTSNWTISGDVGDTCGQIITAENHCSVVVLANPAHVNFNHIFLGNSTGTNNITVSHVELQGLGMFTYVQEHGTFTSISCNSGGTKATVVGSGSQITSGPSSLGTLGATGYTHPTYVGQPVLVNNVTTAGFNTSNTAPAMVVSITDATHYVIGSGTWTGAAAYSCPASTTDNSATGQWQGISSQNEIGFKCLDNAFANCNSNILDHAYFHDFGSGPIQLTGGSLTIHDSSFYRSACGTTNNHSEIVALQHNSLTWYNNLAQDNCGTGNIVSLNSGTASSNTISIYNSIFRTSQNSLTTATDNGTVACINGNTCNITFIGNTIANVANNSGLCTDAGMWFNDTGTTGTAIVRDNLWYGNNCNVRLLLNGTSAVFTEDHNSICTSAGSYPGVVSGFVGTGDNVACTSYTSPFASLFTDQHIATNSSNISGGLSQGAPYNVDKDGVARVGGNWTVGAYQLSGLPIVATPVISPVTGSYTFPLTVTLSDATSGATICYRRDGVTPTSSSPGVCAAGSTTYSGTYSVASSETDKAIGTKSGATDSGVASATYSASAALLSFAPSPCCSPGFVNIVQGATSPVQTITVSNIGGSTDTISSVTITGANAADFALVGGTLGGTLAAGASGTKTLTFTPSTTGPETAQLNVNGTFNGIVTLNGTGIPVPVTPAPAQQLIISSFGNSLTLSVKNATKCAVACTITLTCQPQVFGPTCSGTVQ